MGEMAEVRLSRRGFFGVVAGAAVARGVGVAGGEQSERGLEEYVVLWWRPVRVYDITRGCFSRSQLIAAFGKLERGWEAQLRWDADGYIRLRGSSGALLAESHRRYASCWPGVIEPQWHLIELMVGGGRWRLRIDEESCASPELPSNSLAAMSGACVL
jgi:hypothetical protein